MKLFSLNSKLKIIILIILFFTISIFLLIKPTTPSHSPSPIPSPVSINNPSLQIINSLPTENQTLAPFEPVKVYFNLPINPNSLLITFVPKVDFTLDFDPFTKILTILPQPPFLPQTRYTLTIDLPSPFALHFITQNEAENFPNWNEEFSKQDQEYINQYGARDQALSILRQTAPITKSNFILEYNYGNNTYLIKIKAPYESTKIEVIDWLKSQGVTDLTNLRLNWIES